MAPASGRRSRSDRTDGVAASAAARAGQAEVFDALGDPTRRQLLARLASDGPLSATQLADGLPISRQAVTKHLAAMGAAGLLATERTGREVRYAVVTSRLDDAGRWLEEVGTQWDRRLDALLRRVERRAD